MLVEEVCAQQANFNYLGNQTNTTVASPNVFVNPSVVPQQSGRQSCWIQYRPVSAQNPSATPTVFGFIFFGPTAPTGTLTSFQLQAGQILDCEQANEVEGDAIWLSSNNTGDTFTIKVK